jgi:hypothetical protein
MLSCSISGKLESPFDTSSFVPIERTVAGLSNDNISATGCPSGVNTVASLPHRPTGMSPEWLASDPPELRTTNLAAARVEESDLFSGDAFMT